MYLRFLDSNYVGGVISQTSEVVIIINLFNLPSLSTIGNHTGHWSRQMSCKVLSDIHTFRYLILSTCTTS